MVSVQWGDIATWVAGVGTVAAFAVAFWQIYVERRARRESEVVAVARERRAQAERVAAWVAGERDPMDAWLAVRNESDQPIYEVIATVVPFQGGATLDPTGMSTSYEFRGFLSVVPPGQYYVKVSSNYHGMQFHPGVMVAFTDQAGLHWLRSGNGELRELSEQPFLHFRMTLPLPWGLPESTLPEGS